jgi:hypothetical protein
MCPDDPIGSIWAHTDMGPYDPGPGQGPGSHWGTWNRPGGTRAHSVTRWSHRTYLGPFDMSPYFEGVCVLPSSWPPARVNVGWDEQFLAPLPLIPGNPGIRRIPLIPRMNSKSQEKRAIYNTKLTFVILEFPWVFCFPFGTKQIDIGAGGPFDCKNVDLHQNGTLVR